MNLGNSIRLSLRDDIPPSGPTHPRTIFIQNNSALAEADNQFIPGNNKFKIVIYTGLSGVVNSSRGLWVNGTNVTTTNVAPAAGNLASSPDFRIGREEDIFYSNQNSTFHKAFGSFDLVEMMVFKGSLTNAERIKVEGYVAHKYGLQGNLDVSHTYKTSAPLGSTVVGKDFIRVNSHNNRREGLRTLLTRHMGRFGVDSEYGTVDSETYTTEASFHKQHRNNRYSVSSSTEGYNPISDNAFVSTQIPATDLQYSWTAKIAKNEYSMTGGLHNTFRYGNKTGQIIINNQVENIINYPSSSTSTITT